MSERDNKGKEGLGERNKGRGKEGLLLFLKKEVAGRFLRRDEERMRNSVLPRVEWDVFL